jgi:chromosome segregation ATPase
MRQSDAKRILQLLTQLTESINGPAGREPEPGTKLPLSDRIDKLDNRVGEVQFGLATLAANTKAEFEKIGDRFGGVESRLDKVEGRLGKVEGRLDRVEGRLDRVEGRIDRVDKRFDEVDKRFDRVDRSIESARVQLLDLVTRLHSELTGRIIDLEVPGPGGKGSGGKGSGGGVPLAS